MQSSWKIGGVALVLSFLDDSFRRCGRHSKHRLPSRRNMLW